MLALASLFLAKIAILPIGAKMMRRYGVKFVFFLGAIGISPLPALWAVGNHLWFVMGLQAVSGLFWGLFEVSLSVIFFNQIRPQQKILSLTAYNFFNSLAVISGSLLGGQILKYFNASISSYYVVFILAAFLRCSVCIWYAWQVRGQPHLLEENEHDRVRPSFSGPISKQVKTV
jgi:MFS family permease